MTPMVSVVMLTFQQEQFISEAIRSILGQDYADFELIIVPVHGDDPTLAILDKNKDSRIRIVKSQYALITHQMNLGSFQARGKYHMYFASDDILLPGSLRKMVNFAESTSSAITYPDFYVMDKRTPGGKYRECGGYSHSRLEEGCYITDVCLVLRSEFMLFLPLRFYEAKSRLWSVWKRMSADPKLSGKINHLHAGTFMYRQHGRNVHSVAASQKDARPVQVEMSAVETVASVERGSVVANDYCVLSSPEIILSCLPQWKFKRMIAYWGTKDKLTPDVWRHHPEVFHVTYDPSVHEGLKSGLNMRLINPNSLLAFVQEDDSYKEGGMK